MAETKTWLDLQESGASDQQPFQEAFAAFQYRFRTFKESRALNAAKHVSRGFCLIAPLKGKFKVSLKATATAPILHTVAILFVVLKNMIFADVLSV